MQKQRKCCDNYIQTKHTTHTSLGVIMPAKSTKYATANLTVGNAHVWSAHVKALYKRSNNVLNVVTSDGPCYLAYFKTNEEVDEVINIIKKGNKDGDC